MNLEIKDTTECSTSASYLNILLKLDTIGKLTNQLHDKRNDFNLSIVNFPYLYSNNTSSPAYCVYISQFIQCESTFSTYDYFLIQGILKANKVISQVIL
jgi:hypothetical protein